jgi:cell division protein FtsI (penicillin-binding protein 3)
LVTALSAIANGGFLMRPYVVEKTLNEKGEVVQSFQPETIRKVISGATAEKVTALLKTTTEKGGTGEGAVPAGYDVAGKTGTAQKVDSLLGGYSETRYTSSFMGFAPSDEPKLALLVVIDEPQGGNYGGVVAAPIFKAIMEKVLPYLHVVPKGTMIVKNGLNSAPRKEASEAQPVIDGIKVGKGAETVVMPDLKGLSMRNALSRIEGRGLIIKVSGNGKVVEQTPRPGTVVERGDICFLKFRSPS